MNPMKTPGKCVSITMADGSTHEVWLRCPASTALIALDHDTQAMCVRMGKKRDRIRMVRNGETYTLETWDADTTLDRCLVGIVTPGIVLVMEWPQGYNPEWNNAEPWHIYLMKIRPKHHGWLEEVPRQSWENTTGRVLNLHPVQGGIIKGKDSPYIPRSPATVVPLTNWADIASQTVGAPEALQAV